MKATLSSLFSVVVFTAMVAANRCVDQPNHKMLPSLESCSRYSLCFNGFETRLECDQASLFDYVLAKCVPADAAQCYSTICPAQGLKYRPDPDSCEAYMICINGEAIRRTCGDGLHWSAKKKRCMHPDSAKCVKPVPAVDSNKCPAVQVPGSVVYLPSAESCSVYYVCYRGEAVALECPVGMHWEQRLSTCISASRSSCQIPEPSVNFEDECRGIVYDIVPFPNSEHRYIVCIGGVGTERRCQGDQQFDGRLRACL